MTKDIAIIIPHKGIGDIIFHHSFISSISLFHRKKIVLIANNSTKINLIYKNSPYVKKIIILDLKRPSKFMYPVKIYYLTHNIFRNSFEKIYYTGNSLWHKISFVIASKIKNIILYYPNQKKKFIIPNLNNFLKQLRIKNINNYKLEINFDKKNNKIFKNNIFRKPWIFLSVDTSENQIKLSNDFLIRLIFNLKKKYKTIFLNTNKQNKNIVNFIKKKDVVKTSQFNIIEIAYLIKNSKQFIGNESGPAVLAAIFKKKSLIFLNDKVLPESKYLPFNKLRKYINKKF